MYDFGAPPMQNSAGVHRVRCATRTASVQRAAESALHLAPRLRDFDVRKRATFREKMRERVAIFLRFRRTARAKLGRRALRALRNTHGVSAARGRVSAAFGTEIARLRRATFREKTPESVAYFV